MEKEYDDPIQYFTEEAKRMDEKRLLGNAPVSFTITYVIVTSEYKESDDRIIEMYRGLWRI